MSDVLGILIAFLPLFLVMVVANIAEGRRRNGQPYRGVAVLAYLLIVIGYGTALFIGLVLQLVGWVISSQPQRLTEVGFPIDLLDQIYSLPLLGMGVWIPSLMGLVLLLPPVRRLLARFMPLDPESPVHAVALSLSMLVLINLTFTLGIGLGNITELLEEQAAAGQASSTMVSLWVQQITMAFFAMIGVGWLIRRDGPVTLRRLGIVSPSSQEILLGVGIGLVMVPLILLLEYLAMTLGLGADPDVEALTEQLLGPLFRTPFGIVTLGLAAALGEETIFRGAAQPRLGVIYTAVLFALVHSNYGITISTLIVFLLGLVLAWVRFRHNTTTAMIVHAVYNMTLGAMAFFGSSLLDV